MGFPIVTILCLLAGLYFLTHYYYTGKFKNNDGTEKARLVMNDIFDVFLNSKGGNLKIYAKNLNGEISGDGSYIRRLKKILDSDEHSISFIVDERPKFKISTTNAYDLLMSYKNTNPDKIKICFLKDTTLDRQNLQDDLLKLFKDNKELITSKSSFEEGHFAVIEDMNCFRFEYNNQQHLAFYCIAPFENEKKVRMRSKALSDSLSKKFDKYFCETPLEKSLHEG